MKFYSSFFYIKIRKIQAKKFKENFYDLGVFIWASSYKINFL